MGKKYFLKDLPDLTQEESRQESISRYDKFITVFVEQAMAEWDFLEKLKDGRADPREDFTYKLAHHFINFINIICPLGNLLLSGLQFFGKPLGSKKSELGTTFALDTIKLTADTASTQIESPSKKSEADIIPDQPKLSLKDSLTVLFTEVAHALAWQYEYCLTHYTLSDKAINKLAFVGVIRMFDAVGKWIKEAEEAEEKYRGKKKEYDDYEKKVAKKQQTLGPGVALPVKMQKELKEKKEELAKSEEKKNQAIKQLDKIHTAEGLVKAIIEGQSGAYRTHFQNQELQIEIKDEKDKNRLDGSSELTAEGLYQRMVLQTPDGQYWIDSETKEEKESGNRRHVNITKHGTAKYGYARVSLELAQLFEYEKLDLASDDLKVLKDQLKQHEPLTKIVEKKDILSYREEVKKKDLASIGSFNDFIGAIAFFSGEIKDVDLSELDFRGVNFSDVTFTDCNMHGTIFDHAHLYNTSFISTKEKDINAEGISFKKSYLASVSFERVNLQKANFDNATVYLPSFKECDLFGVHIVNTAKWKNPTFDEETRTTMSKDKELYDELMSLKETYQEEIKAAKTQIDELKSTVTKYFEKLDQDMEYLTKKTDNLAEKMAKVESDQKDMKSDIEGLKDTSLLYGQEIVGLQEKVSQLGESEKESTIEITDKIPKSLNKRYEIASEIPLLLYGTDSHIKIDDLYIRLAIVKAEEQKEKEETLRNAKYSDSAVAHGLYEAIYQAKEEIALEKLFDKTDKEELPSCIYIKGRAGAGKTTLCRRIAYQWSQPSDPSQRLWSKQYKRIYWISLRDLKNLDLADKSKYSLADLLAKEKYRDDVKEDEDETEKIKLDSDQFKAILAREDILWLLDGWDEIKLEMQELPLPTQNLINQLWSAKRLIVTSRPLIEPSKKVDRTIEILGLSTKDIEGYIDKFFALKGTLATHPERLESKKRELKILIKENSSLKCICQIPICLELICSLCDLDNLGKVSTITEIYNSITEALLVRYLKKSGHPPTSKVDIRKNTETEIKILSHIAYEGIKKNPLTISGAIISDAIGQLCTSDKKIDTKTLLDNLKAIGLIKAVKNHTLIDHEEYYFQHLTFQDFFAARYIAEHIDSSEIINFIKEKLEDDRYWNVWGFVAGLLKNHEVQWLTFMNLLKKHRDKPKRFSLLVRCIEEGEKTTHKSVQADLAQTGMIHKFVWDTFNFEIIPHTSFTPTPAGGYLPKFFYIKDEKVIRVITDLQLSPKVLVSSHILEDLLHMVKSEEDLTFYYRLRALEILSNFIQINEEIKQLFFNCCKHLSNEVRRGAIYGLKILAPEDAEARTLLVKAFKDPAAEVRREAIDAGLGYLVHGDSEAQDLLFKVCCDPSSEVRHRAIYVLRNLAKEDLKAQELFNDLKEKGMIRRSSFPFFEELAEKEDTSEKDILEEPTSQTKKLS